jgi:hypothetical protein
LPSHLALNLSFSLSLSSCACEIICVIVVNIDHATTVTIAILMKRISLPILRRLSKMAQTADEKHFALSSSQTRKKIKLTISIFISSRYLASFLVQLEFLIEKKSSISF